MRPGVSFVWSVRPLGQRTRRGVSQPDGCEVVATAALQRNGPVRRVASIGTGDRQAAMMAATTARVSGWFTLAPPPPGKRLLTAPPDDVPGAGVARPPVAGPLQFTLSPRVAIERHILCPNLPATLRRLGEEGYLTELVKKIP